jgi:hypothetical protein
VGDKFVTAFARALAYEWCDVYEVLSRRTTNIVRFECGTFEYLYDDFASLETTGRVAYDPLIEARLVAVSAAVGNSGWESKMAETANKRGIP